MKRRAFCRRRPTDGDERSKRAERACTTLSCARAAASAVVNEPMKTSLEWWHICGRAGGRAVRRKAVDAWRTAAAAARALAW